VTTAPLKPIPYEVSDKLPGIESRGVHSYIWVLIMFSLGSKSMIAPTPAKRVSRTSVALALSILLFSWVSHGVVDGGFPVFVVYFFRMLYFFNGGSLLLLFSNTYCFSSVSFFFCC
jgi:hypothetical protein